MELAEEKALEAAEALEAAKVELRNDGRRCILVKLGTAGVDQQSFIFEFLDRKKMETLTRQLQKCVDPRTEKADVSKATAILVNAAKFQCRFGREHLEYFEGQYPQSLGGEVMERLMEIAKGSPEIEVM